MINYQNLIFLFCCDIQDCDIDDASAPLYKNFALNLTPKQRQYFELWTSPI